MQLLLIIIIHWLNRLTDSLSCIPFWKNMKKHKEFVSIYKASCHSSPGDLLSLKDDRTPLWRLRKFRRFIIDHPVTCWILSFTPHRWSVAGNPYETDPAYVLSSLSGVLFGHSVAHIHHLITGFSYIYKLIWDSVNVSLLMLTAVVEIAVAVMYLIKRWLLKRSMQHIIHKLIHWFS